MYNKDNQIRFRTSALRSSLYDYSDANILVQGTTTVAKETDAAPNNANIKVIFKSWTPCTSSTSRINSTQVDDAQYIDVVMPMYNLIEQSNNYLKTSGILRQYCRDALALAADNAITDFTNSVKIKETLAGQTGTDGKKGWHNGIIKISK